MSAWVAMAGCSGDDNKTDAGPDATSDVATDAPNDVGVKDAIADADAGDAYDATALLAFPGKELLAFCKRLQGCCFVDAGTGSIASCETQLGGSIEGSLSEVVADPSLLDGGRLRLDDTAANSCLAGLSTMTCGDYNYNDGGGSVISATEYSTIVQNCYSAIYGTIPIGQTGCKSAIECVPGAFCTGATGTDGGPTTKCVALEGSGQGPCTTTNNVQCQYRGYLGTALTCEDAGAGGNTCTAKLGNGANCIYSYECTSGLCNQYANGLSQPACAAAAPWVDIQTCDAIFNTDAGQ